MERQSSQQLRPQEDPNRSRVSGQYDYSLHSVPVKTSHHIQRNLNNGVRRVTAKHRKRRPRGHRDQGEVEAEADNPSDIVAEILGEVIEVFQCHKTFARRH